MNRKAAMIVLATILAWGPFAVSAERPQRVTQDLLVLYSFEGPASDTLRDQSGVGEPLDLRIDKRQGLDWRGDRLLVNSAAGISSTEPARKVIAAVKQSGELTVEAWIKPSDPIAADPDNRLLWKMRPQRLEAEILRDAMLAVSGTLNRQSYGPGFKPAISSEAMVARNTKDPYPSKVDDSPDVRRRSVYMFHKRVVPYPLLQAFDKPDAQQSCNRRDPTTVAPQALALLNDQFVRIVALDFADRLIKESESKKTDDGDIGSEPAQWIERGYPLTLGRAPSASERAASLEFVQTQIKERTSRSPQSPAEEIQRRALADLCQAWFSLNEFLYID